MISPIPDAVIILYHYAVNLDMFWTILVLFFDTGSGDDLYRNGALYSVDFLTRTIGDSLDSVDSFWQDLNYGT